jgi:hypothetical protein
MIEAAERRTQGALFEHLVNDKHPPVRSRNPSGVNIYLQF